MKLLKLSLIFVFIVTLVISFRLWSFANKTLDISVFKGVFTNGDLRIVNNSVNFLILGMPGSTYEGPQLSDSIVYINYNFDTNKAVLFGIPRDIWSNSLKDKVNTAYTYGEAIKEGGGLILSKAEVGAIVGVPIQYGIVLSFDDFKQIVDYFGVIEIDVERAFTDKKYPIKGKEADNCGGNDEEYLCRYETVSFDSGIVEMDGDTALKFIRSRNAIGAEGNDFARIKRQQIIAESIKNKVISNFSIFSIDKNKDFYNHIDNLIERDISNQQAAALLKNILLKRNLEVVKKTIPNDLFFTPEFSSYDGRYVLTPKNDNYENIHEFIQ
ncbi:MAG: LCP family protein, partial [Patescibacteria group bacterium]